MTETPADSVTASLDEPECVHEGTPWCIVHERLWVGSFDRCEGRTA